MSEVAPPQKTPAADAKSAKSLPVKDLEASKGVLEFSEDEIDWLRTQKVAHVAVRVGDFAKGTLPLEMVGRDGSVKTPGGKSKHYALELESSVAQRLAGLGLHPVLAVRYSDDKATGFLSAAVGTTVLQSPQDLVKKIQANPVGAGLKGVNLGSSLSSIGKIENIFENGVFRFSLQGVRIRAYFFEGSAGITWTSQGLGLNGTLAAHLPGLQQAEITILRTPEGLVTANGILLPNLGPTFSGSIALDYVDGRGKIEGTLGYTTEKLSGQVHVMVADEASAKAALNDAIGPENVVNLAAPEKSEKTTKKESLIDKPVLMGWGDVNFQFNKWLSGKTRIVFDHRGFVTIIGEIALPPEIPLIPGKSFSTPPVGPMAKAFYGIPWVAEVYVAGGLSFNTFATIAPLTLRNLRVEGLYSTDPLVLQHFNIMGNLNLSAEAGLALSVWARIGASILFHDVSLTGTLKSSAGIRAYADAAVALGYQEKQDPVLGKKGDFLFTGMFEFAAQPFVRLQGDLQYKLDAPWLSPVSSTQETWPFLDWSYGFPAILGVKFGLKDYVIGTEPDFIFQMGDVTFDTDKFLESAVEKERHPDPSAGQKALPMRSQVPLAPPVPATPKNPLHAPPMKAPAAPPPVPAQQAPPAKKQPEKAAGSVKGPTKGNVKPTEDTKFLEYATTVKEFAEKAEKSKWSKAQLEAEVKKMPGYKLYRHTVKEKSKGVATLQVFGKAPKPLSIDIKYVADSAVAIPADCYTATPVPKPAGAAKILDQSVSAMEVNVPIWRMFCGSKAHEFSKSSSITPTCKSWKRATEKDQRHRPHFIKAVAGAYYGPRVPVTKFPILERTDAEDRGHLIAAALGGKNEAENLVPMEKSQNSNGDWWKREMLIGKFYEGKVEPNLKGLCKRVDMKVTLDYDRPESRKPSRIHMETRFFMEVKGVKTDITDRIPENPSSKITVDNPAVSDHPPTNEERKQIEIDPCVCPPAGAAGAAKP